MAGGSEASVFRERFFSVVPFPECSLKETRVPTGGGGEGWSPSFNRSPQLRGVGGYQWSTPHWSSLQPLRWCFRNILCIFSFHLLSEGGEVSVNLLYKMGGLNYVLKYEEVREWKKNTKVLAIVTSG